jgi:hypothetical protein
MLNENSPNSPADSQRNPAVDPEERSLSRPLNKALTVALCAGGWAIPGLGHILLGRWMRGLLLSVSVLVMFALGLAMQGELYRPESSAPQEFMSQIFRTLGVFANAGVGVAYFLAIRAGAGQGVMTAQTFDYGWAYLIVSGLLNYLIVLDAFDIAQGRKP